MVQDLARIRATGLVPHEALLHVPGFASGDTTARAAKLYGGTVNQSYRVDTSAGRYVVRIHDSAGQVLGANHEREAQLHAAAAAAGLAPALIHVDAAYRFVIMEHVSGPLWTSQDFALEERLRQLGATLHALHSIVPPTVAPFDVRAVLRRHCERLVEGVPEERAWFTQLMERAAVALLALDTSPRARTLVHNDLHHSNLVGKERLFLLDWEYAAVADPLLDLACVLAYYPHAVPHADTLLEAARLGEVASPEMLQQATWLCMLVSYFWYRSRRLAKPDATPAELAAEQGLLKRLR
ncbi:MAG: phosphotransferase [Gammaproteobacteria bacterium]